MTCFYRVHNDITVYIGDRVERCYQAIKYIIGPCADARSIQLQVYDIIDVAAPSTGWDTM